MPGIENRNLSEFIGLPYLSTKNFIFSDPPRRTNQIFFKSAHPCDGIYRFKSKNRKFFNIYILFIFLKKNLMIFSNKKQLLDGIS